jgi:hypothetical protein
MKGKEREYKDLENFKQNFVIELRTFMLEAVEKINRLEGKNANQFYEEKIKEAQTFLEERNQLLDQQNYLNEKQNTESQAIEIEENKVIDVENLIEKYASEADNNFSASFQTGEIVTFEMENARKTDEQASSFFDDLNK